MTIMQQPRPALVLALLAAAACLAAAARPASLEQHQLASQSQLLPPAPASRRALLAQKLLGLDREHKRLRVLAHGDSITEGWIDTAQTKTPWTPWLQQQLKQKLGGDWDVEVVNGGMGGAGVTDELFPLFERQLSEARSQGRPYSYITFLAGINDIMGKTHDGGTHEPKKAPEIFERMKAMWALANAEGSTVLVIPTLPTNADGDYEAQRRALTDKVRAYVRAQREAGNKGLVLLDMEHDFDYSHLPEQRRRFLFDDGVHLTQPGYELMGQLVYQRLLTVMGLA